MTNDVAFPLAFVKSRNLRETKQEYSQQKFEKLAMENETPNTCSLLKSATSKQFVAHSTVGSVKIIGREKEHP